jgi:hypothetical protein
MLEYNFSYFEELFAEDLLKEQLLLEESQDNIISEYYIKQRKNRAGIKGSQIIKKF